MNAPSPRHSTPVYLGKIPAKYTFGIALLLALSGCQSTTLPPVYAPTAMVVMPESASETIVDSASSFVEQTDATLQSPLSDKLETSSWLSSIDESFVQAKSLVETQLDIKLDHVTLQVVGDAAINEEVAHETRKLISAQFGTTDYAQQFLDHVMQPLAGTYAALYSPRLEAVLISRTMLRSYEQSLIQENDAPTRQAALLTLLIHELVHAADDTRHNIHDNRTLSFRASFAQSATFEGHAQWVTRQICKKEQCEAGLEALDNFMFSTNEPANQLTQPMEAISRNVLEYSYVEGEHFIRDLAARDEGQELINDLLSNPPVDPIQILAPGSYPDNAREARNQSLLTASRAIKHPWTTPDWVGIETSPLKGIDLRSDPIRRQAAIDGFTRLIQGMVSLQYYDQQAPGVSPVEATLLQAESASTASLFANVLHKNTHQPGAEISDETVSIETSEQDQGAASLEIQIYRTYIDEPNSFRTAIAVSGLYVVQVSGSDVEQSVLDDYVVEVLIKLNLQTTSAQNERERNLVEG